MSEGVSDKMSVSVVEMAGEGGGRFTKKACTERTSGKLANVSTSVSGTNRHPGSHDQHTKVLQQLFEQGHRFSKRAHHRFRGAARSNSCSSTNACKPTFSPSLFCVFAIHIASPTLKVEKLPKNKTERNTPNLQDRCIIQLYCIPSVMCPTNAIPRQRKTHRLLGALWVLGDEGVDDVLPLVGLAVKLLDQQGQQLVRHVLRTTRRREDAPGGLLASGNVSEKDQSTIPGRDRHYPNRKDLLDELLTVSVV